MCSLEQWRGQSVKTAGPLLQMHGRLPADRLGSQGVLQNLCAFTDSAALCCPAQRIWMGKLGGGGDSLAQTFPLPKMPLSTGLVCPPAVHLASASPLWTHHRCHFLLGDSADLHREKGDFSLLGVPSHPSRGPLGLAAGLFGSVWRVGLSLSCWGDQGLVGDRPSSPRRADCVHACLREVHWLKGVAVAPSDPWNFLSKWPRPVVTL